MKAFLSILTLTLLLMMPVGLWGTERQAFSSDMQKTMAQVAKWQINNFTYQKKRKSA